MIKSVAVCVAACNLLRTLPSFLTPTPSHARPAITPYALSHLAPHVPSLIDWNIVSDT